MRPPLELSEFLKLIDPVEWHRKWGKRPFNGGLVIEVESDKHCVVRGGRVRHTKLKVGDIVYFEDYDADVVDSFNQGEISKEQMEKYSSDGELLCRVLAVSSLKEMLTSAAFPLPGLLDSEYSAKKVSFLELEPLDNLQILSLIEEFKTNAR